MHNDKYQTFYSTISYILLLYLSLIDSIPLNYFQNITCGRELTNLLINLFPSSSWHDHHIKMKNILPSKKCIILFDLIDNITIYDPRKNIPSTISRPTTLSSSSSTSSADDNHTTTFLSTIDEYDILNDKSYVTADETSVEMYKTKEFYQHLKRKIPSVDFSTILLNLMIGLVEDENLSVIDKSSTTVQCLAFGLEKLMQLSGDQMAVTENNSNNQKPKSEHLIFENLNDCDIIMEKLLVLVLYCLNNIFNSNKCPSDLIDVGSIVRQLLQVLRFELERDCKLDGTKDFYVLRCDIIFGIYYYLYIMMNNTYLSKVEDELIQIFNDVMEKLQRYTHQIYEILKKSDKSVVIYRKISKLFLKIIRNFKALDDGRHDSRGRRMNKKLMKNQQPRHHHKNRNKINLKCMVESNLFTIIGYLPYDAIKKILKLIQTTNTFCCCNTNFELLATLFGIIKTHPKSLRLILNFLRNSYINLILNTSCDHCSNRINSMQFQCQLAQHFTEIIAKIPESDYSTILDHIGKLPNTLPKSLARKIIFDITVPVFEKYKLRITNYNTNDDTEELKLAKAIVYSCLNIFANYLSDFNLISEFFTESIIQHLDDLMIHYEIVPNIFRLIKIGLYNFDESSTSYLSIHRKIMKMPIATTIVVTNNLLALFTRLGAKNKNLNLKTVEQKSSNNDNVKKHCQSHSLLFELRLAAVYWNMTLQLLQTNDQFKSEFKETFNEHHEDSTLITIIYNTLSCIININQFNNYNNLNNSKISSISFPNVSSTSSYVSTKTCYQETDLINLPDHNDFKNYDFEYENVFYENLNRNKPKSALILKYDEPISYEIELCQNLNHNQFYQSGLTQNQCIDDDDINDDNESKLIYDVNNFKSMDRSSRKLMQLDSYYRQFVCNNKTDEILWLMEGSGAVSGDVCCDDSNGEKNSVFIRLFNWIFPFHHDSNYRDNHMQAVDDEINVLKSTECRKILFQLFEITLSAYLMDLPGHIFGKLINLI